MICGTKDGNFLVARYNSDGSVDTTFASVGYVIPGAGNANHVTISPIGRIIAGGAFAQVAMVSYLPDGTPDTTFDGDGILLLGTGIGFTDAVVQSDLRIVAAASFGSQAQQIIKINSNGSLDTSFSMDGVVDIEGASKVALQPDGKIVTTGQRLVSPTNAAVFTARLLNTVGIASAANVSVSGRVLTANGQGLRNATVIVSGGELAEPRTAITSAFGYFAIDDIPAGATYVVAVNSKRFVFQPRILTLNDELTELEFVADDALGVGLPKGKK